MNNVMKLEAFAIDQDHKTSDESFYNWTQTEYYHQIS